MVGLAAGLAVVAAMAPALVSSSAAATPTSTTSAGNSDWPSYLFGPSHTSYNTNATSITSSKISTLQPIWRWNPPASPNSGTTGLLASPSVVDGVVYIGVKDGYFYAISEATQQVLWSDFLGIDLPKGDCGVNDTQGIAATANVATDPVTNQLMVYVNAPDGYIDALNANTGALVWKGVVDTPSTTQNDYYSWSSPLVVNGKVYVGLSSDCGNPLIRGGVVSLDQETGASVASWFDLPAGQTGGSVWSSLAAATDGSILVATGNGQTTLPHAPLYAQSIVKLDPNSLAIDDYWQVPLSEQNPDGDFGASPTTFTADIGGVQTPMVGACNKNGIYYALRQNDLSAGPVWQDQIAVGYSGGAVECDAAATWNGKDLIEGGGAPSSSSEPALTGSIQEINPSTGALIWQTHLDGTVIGAPTEDGAGVVAAPIYQSSDGNTGVYLVNSTTGAIIDFIATPMTPIFAQPVFANNNLLVAAGPGFGLTAYQVTQNWAAIKTVSPNSLIGATTKTVTLTGSGFTGTPQVFVSGGPVAVSNVTVVSPTTLTFTAAVPRSAGWGADNVTVIEPGTPAIAHTCTACLTLVAPPNPSSADPPNIAQGASHEAVTLHGSNFLSGAKVTSHTGITVATTFVSSTQLNLDVSVSATQTPGRYSLVVTNPGGGVGNCNGCLSVIDPAQPPPTVTSVQPSSIKRTGSYPALIINGTDFTSSSTVALSLPSVQVRSVTYVSPTELTIAVHVPGTAPLVSGDVTVSDQYGSGKCTACLKVVAQK